MFLVLQVADFPLQAALRASVSVGGPVSHRPESAAQAGLFADVDPAARATAAGQRPALLPASPPLAGEGDAPTSPRTASSLPPPDLYLTHPAALFSGTTKRSVALAVNAPARAAGVTPGLSAPQAVARCADLLIRAPHPDAEAEARALLLAAAFTVSPHVEDTAPGVATLDVAGLAPHTRGPACAAALSRLALLGLHATAGIARTPLLARYAADASSPASARSRSLTRSPALGFSNGENEYEERITERTSAVLREIPANPAAEAAFLAPLPLATFAPETEIADVLRAWGLRAGGDLTHLARDDVGRRLGAAGAALWDRARGGEPRPLHLVTPPQEFVAAQEFEESLETLEPLLFILRRFLDRLTLELEAAHRVAVELDLTLTLEDETAHARSFRLPEPTRDATILFRTLHTHLESVRTASPIVAARLRVTPTRPLVRQPGLFETGLRDPHGFAETLARVAALLGAERIGTPQLEDTHRPDAVRLVPPAAIIAAPAPPPVQPLIGRPLRRFRPPLPARFELSEGYPALLWTDRIQGEVIAQRGPWFNSGDWWEESRAWQRAEWDIALADGGLYRLVRTPAGWFLEGEYD